MNRRFHVDQLSEGTVHLDVRQSRHLRDVLRIRAGENVELFDNAGKRAAAVVVETGEPVVLKVERVEQGHAAGVELIIAAAVPKGPRADWMVEKLSELGVARYTPLETARSVVHPEAGKLQRWGRIAEESAKQCKRGGVMQIGAPTGLKTICADAAWQDAVRWCMAAGEGSVGIMEALPPVSARQTVVALIGPEGGWTDDELKLVEMSRFHLVRLTRTILRVETAALAVAAVVMAGAPVESPATAEEKENA